MEKSETGSVLTSSSSKVLQKKSIEKLNPEKLDRKTPFYLKDRFPERETCAKIVRLIF